MKYCIAIGEKTSPTTPLTMAGDFVTCMEYVKSIGYDAVEIHVAAPEKLDTDTLVAACKRLDMEIITIGTGGIYVNEGLSLVDDSLKIQIKVVERLKIFIDKAAILKCQITIGGVKGNIPKDGSREAYLAAAARNLSELSDYAVAKGVIILLEATNRFENNYFNTAKEIHDFIKLHELKNVRILMDSFHINIEEKSIEKCLLDTGDLLGHIHFGDNTRQYPGQGCFDFVTFKQAILDYPFDGVLSIECLPVPDSKTVALETIKFFKKNFNF